MMISRRSFFGVVASVAVALSRQTANAWTWQSMGVTWNFKRRWNPEWRSITVIADTWINGKPLGLGFTYTEELFEDQPETVDKRYRMLLESLDRVALMNFETAKPTSRRLLLFRARGTPAWPFLGNSRLLWVK